MDEKTWVEERKFIVDAVSIFWELHSFSNKVLEKYGIWHLKEVLGHQTVNTTQAYVESLSTKQLNKTDDVFDW